MNTRKLILISAAMCISPLAFAQTGSNDAVGGSAGDGDKPMTYTRATFPELDKNKNGVIEKKEQSAGKLDAALVKKMDTNGDGQVSEAEFDAYQAMTQGNKVPKVQ